MPEGLKSFLQEASLLEVGGRLEEIVASCGVTLEEEAADTKLHTGCVMLGMVLPNLATVQLVAELRRKLQHVGSLATASEAMTTGEMLLCAADTLFDKVNSKMVGLQVSAPRALHKTLPRTDSLFTTALI